MAMVTWLWQQERIIVFSIPRGTLRAIVMLSMSLVRRQRLLIRNGLRNKVSALIKEIKYS